MNSFLNNVIKHFNTQGKDLGDPNLKQGQRFDFMQNQIISQNIHNLPLMEQTTGNGLGSIIEPLTGKHDGKESKLKALEESELKKLGRLETEYENLIYKLQGLNNVANNSGTYTTDETATGNTNTNTKKFWVTEKGKPCPSGYSVLKNPKTCNTFLSNLKDNPAEHKGDTDIGELDSYQLDDGYMHGSSQGGDKSTTIPIGCSILEATAGTLPGAGNSCTESYGETKLWWDWEEDRPCSKRAPICVGHQLDQWRTGKCEGNLKKDLTKWPQYNTGPSKVTSAPNNHLICVEKLSDEVFDEIKKVNKEIKLSINKLNKQTKHTGQIHKGERKHLDKSRNDFSSSLDGLIKKKEDLDNLLQGYNTIGGQLQDRMQEMNSTYIDYIAWFICAVTIGGVAMYKLPSRS